jgi:hypothetical protein
MGEITSVLQDWGKFGNLAVLVSTTFAVFVFIERMSSKRVRADFAEYLQSQAMKEHSAVRLPADTLSVFEKVFGADHFSFKCITRSILFSIAATTIMLTLMKMSDPYYHLSNFLNRTWIIYFAVYVSWSLIPDYLNLFKTRIVLKMLLQREVANPIALLGILVADFVIGILVFAFGSTLANYSAYRATGSLLALFALFPSDFTEFWPAVYGIVLHSVASAVIVSLNPLSNFLGALFWAGMLPSVWLWLYVGATWLTRLIALSDPVLRFLVYFLDVKDHPIRSVGVIAAGVVGAAYSLYLLASQLL